MGEVDTVFYIKQVYTNLAIHQPWLTHRGITDPKSFLKALRPNSYFHGKRRKPILENIVEDAFMKADDPKKSGRMKQYQAHEDALLQHIKTTKDVKIPIFTEGMSVTGFGRAEKEGIDPYSNSHLFTTLLIAHAYYHHDIDFLKKLQFWSVQPITYVSEFFEENAVPGIKEIVEMPGWRGTLFKTDDIGPKIGNSRFNPSLLDARGFEKKFIAPEELQANGVDSVDDFLEKKRIEAYVNQEIMALKFATIFDILAPQLKLTREKYDIPGYPLFMGKTSPSAKIMELAAKYTKGFTPLEYVGGEWGIHADNDLPMLGICEPTAMGRLFGFFQAIAQQDGTEAKQYMAIPPKLAVQKIRYATHADYPFLLIEQELPLEKNQVLNISLPDVFAQFTQQQQRLISDFAYTHRLGFSAIQPRIVSLLTRDRSIYHDLRWKNKENSRWLYELERKRIALPSEFQTLASASQPMRLPTDFRGSEFTLPTNVRLNQELFDDVASGKLRDVGCTINKLLSGLNLKRKIPFLEAQLAVSPQEIVDEYWKYHMPSHESYAAVRGNAIHALCHYSHPKFAHNQTLEILGLPIVPASEYSQTTYHLPWTTKSGPTLLHANPDVALFLEGENAFDTIILDTKTNRVTSYPEHRYTLQTFFYGWVFKELFKSQRKPIDNIYTVLNKQAFYRGFDGQSVETTSHEEHRRQQFSPITKFNAKSDMHALMPLLVNGIVDEKRELLQHASAFLPYKEKQKKCGRCDDCYLSDSLVCDRLAFLAQSQNITPILAGMSLDKSKV